MKEELNCALKRDIPLAPLTTMGIGGRAKWFTKIHTIEQMQSIMLWCKERGERFWILGKGSNSIFHEKGFDGLVILNKIQFLEDSVPGQFYVGAGYSFPLLGTQTAKKGYKGLEFAAGIPASVGGAVFMNAGASGQETATFLTHVDFVDQEGVLHRIAKEQLIFSYRSSCFQKKKGAIVAANFLLETGDNLRDKQRSLIDYRLRTQPYKEASAGCVFRNPPEYPAGKLIEELGMKNKSVGGAMVSSMHANFIVNKGNATQKDVLELIAQIREEIKKAKGIDLEVEVICVPYADPACS